MSRRPRVQYTLDTGNIKMLSEKDIKMILRATDELISIGGRNMLAKILKGSKDKKVLEYKLDECPAYGYFRSLTLEKILHRVDWMIREDYIRIDYDGRLPMLIFSEKGWAIKEETFAEEIYQKFCINLKLKKFEIISDMKTLDRQVVFDVIQKICDSKNTGFLPMLEAWKAVEVRKVRERIEQAQRSLNNPESDESGVSYERAKRDDWREVMNLVHKTVHEVYPHYYPAEVVDFFCIYHDKQRIQANIGNGAVWVLRRNGRIIGTGSAEGCHITGVYILPEEQKKGYGTLVMQELEQSIAKHCQHVELDASLPACLLYEKLGYHTARHVHMPLFNDAVLVYAVMEKMLPSHAGRSAE